MSDMRWLRKRDRQPFSKQDSRRYDEAATDRLRGIAELECVEQDPEAVEARLRNMVYGTNRQ